MSSASRLAVVAAYVGMCLIWGTTWLGIKFSLESIGPVTGVGLRFVIAGLLMYAVALATGKLKRPSELPWRVIAVFATLLFGFNYLLNYLAETHLPSGLVSVLFGTLPFFSFALARAMIGERATLQNWAGALVAFVGVGVISLGEAVQGSPWFALAPIVAAAFASVANVYAKKHAHHEPIVTLPPSMLLSGAGLLVAGLLIERTDWAAAFSLPSIGALLYLAVLGSCVAFFLMLWLLARVPVWVIGVSTLITPVIALAVGVLIGGEHLDWRELLGSAVVVLGIGVSLFPKFSVEKLPDTP